MNTSAAINVGIQDFLSRMGLEEAFYPGKRVVKKLPQPGEHKSHCIVYDWRHPEFVHVEFKAGLTGKTLPAKDLKKYPLSFQSPTYIDIAVTNEARRHNEDEEEEGETSAGGSSGGGVKMNRKPSMNAFSAVVKGRIPDLGEVKKIVLMGMDIGKGAFAAVLDSLAAQIKNMAIAPVNILASVKNVTRVAPGGRPRAEIDPSLLHGAKPYKPQDMFGVPVLPKQ